MAGEIIVPPEIALWHPFTDDKKDVLLTPDIVCLHTMVGTLTGSYSWANQPGNPYWTFGVAGDGDAWQCRDLRYVTAANLQGNWHVIPIETADCNEGIWPKEWTNPLWTEAQFDRLVILVAWLCKRFNIPPVLIPNTVMPRRGIAYHRQGIPGNIEYVEGGERWSNVEGKSCPANRVSQVDDLIAEVQKLMFPILPLPTEEEKMMIITNPRGQSLMVVEGLGLMGMGSTARTAYVDEGKIKNVHLSEAEFDRWENNLPRLDA